MRLLNCDIMFLHLNILLKLSCNHDLLNIVGLNLIQHQLYKIDSRKKLRIFWTVFLEKSYILFHMIHSLYFEVLNKNTNLKKYFVMINQIHKIIRLCKNLILFLWAIFPCSKLKICSRKPHSPPIHVTSIEKVYKYRWLKQLYTVHCLKRTEQKAVRLLNMRKAIIISLKRLWKWNSHWLF